MDLKRARDVEKKNQQQQPKIQGKKSSLECSGCRMSAFCAQMIN